MGYSVLPKHTAFSKCPEGTTEAAHSEPLKLTNSLRRGPAAFKAEGGAAGKPTGLLGALPSGGFPNVSSKKSQKKLVGKAW